jgi:hypothetical protein
MTQRVKIECEANGVTQVTAVNGIQQGAALFIDRCNLGKIGEIVDVPEFWVEGDDGMAAATFFSE